MEGNQKKIVMQKEGIEKMQRELETFGSKNVEKERETKDAKTQGFWG